MQPPSILFRFSECLDPLLEKKKISPFPYPVLPPEICNMIFFLNPEFHKFIKLLRWMKTMKGLTFLCYKNELGHKQLLLIVFGIRKNSMPIYPLQRVFYPQNRPCYKLPISFLSIHPF